MKILHVITSLRTGGAESLITQIVPRLIEKGHTVEIALFDGTDTAFKRSLEQAGVKVHSLAYGQSVYNPLHIVRLRKLIGEFDVIHTHNTAPQFFAAIANIGISKKLVTTEHGGSNRRRKWKWFAPIDRWMYARYLTTICISDKAECNLREFIKSKSNRITTINNGIDVRRLANAEPLRELRDKLPAGTKIITMVAGFRWEKDQPTLIKSLSELPEKFHLILVGDGARRNEYEDLVNQLELQDRIHLLGLRTDVPEILKASDYIVMSSHFEGLSLSSLEGMAVGKPFLASDVDGLREVVNGAGTLFPHEDASALASEIMKLDNDTNLYRKTSEACAARAAMFDISKMVDGYLQIYETC